MFAQERIVVLKRKFLFLDTYGNLKKKKKILISWCFNQGFCFPFLIPNDSGHTDTSV